MSQYDDTQIGQFILEDLPKLVWHLTFLRDNPDVLIHFGFNKQEVMEKTVLPHNFFNLLGLRHRLVNGTVFAKNILIPREGGCQDVGYNMWELLNMREGILLIIYICNFHVSNHLLLVYICKLHWKCFCA
jgi:hypothetical protein